MEADPSDSNHPTDDEVPLAHADLVARAREEAEAVSKLSAADQNAYRILVEAIAARPVARVDLQRMLLSARLPGSGHDRGLLEHLSSLAEQPLEAGIDRSALLAEVIREVADPARISQKGKGTCSATSVSIMLAITNPPEYVRLVAG